MPSRILSLTVEISKYCHTSNDEIDPSNDPTNGPADNPVDDLTNKDSCSNVWKQIGNVIVENPVVQDSLRIDKSNKILVLLALLCMAVSEECNKQTTYIGEILKINDVELQRTLMEVIERGFE